MIKIYILLTAFIVIANTSNAAFNESKEERKETFYTFSPAFESKIAGIFTKLNRQELERLTGRRLTLKERIAFTLLKLKARHHQNEEQTSGFNFEGFLLGFVVTALGSAFLGLLGLFLFGIIGFLLVIGSFVFSKDKNYQKWILLGWLAGIVASLIILYIRLTVG